VDVTMLAQLTQGTLSYSGDQVTLTLPSTPEEAAPTKQGFSKQFLQAARLPVATDHDLEVIVFCSEGYTSSLAAAALQDLGLWRATDMVGGFHAWRAAGLPIVPASNAS
jgi:rhodanese-related sulfurtransferase